jgi:hypothetical protein
MPGANILSAQQINSDIAGLTHTGLDQAGAPAPPTMTEDLTHLGLVSELDHVLSGGAHPESVWQMIDRSVVQPTDSLAGKLGGLVPRVGGALANGPAGPISSTMDRVKAGLKRMGL